jgi:hypothetical protein
MNNPRLSKEDREDLFKPLFSEIVNMIVEASDGDEDRLWALRRKIAKELVYLERSRPSDRARLKKLMMSKQGGRCAICEKELPEKGSELDRFVAKFGYIESNVRLVHHECHINDQAAKRYT